MPPDTEKSGASGSGSRHVSGAGLAWAGYFILLGLGMLAGGLYFPSVDPVYVYSGGLTLAVGFIVLFVATQLWRLRAFWFFCGAWLLGTVANYFPPLRNAGLFYMVAFQMGFADFLGLWALPFDVACVMFSSAIVHGPLLLVTCLLYERYRRRLYPRIWLLCIAALVLGVLLPRYTCVVLEKDYPTPPSEIDVSSDRLEDKNPEFLDDPVAWQEDEELLWHRFRKRINKSAAVIGLDIAELADDEESVVDRLFPTYRDALRFAEERGLPLVPSFQMIDHRSKVFADDLYAAVELFMQDHAEAPGGGKARFLAELLKQLSLSSGKPDVIHQAMAHTAAATVLGGGEAGQLPGPARNLAEQLRGEFEASPLNSKVVSFYEKSERLTEIFRQDRFLQSPLAPDVAIGLARVLNARPELKEVYLAVLALNSRMSNPPARFSLADVCERTDLFHDSPALLADLAGSDKGKAFAVFPDGHQIQFWPRSLTKENVLFSKLFGGNFTLPKENLMNVLINHIRAGKLDLKPTADSGWYDYQTYALETLLLPERAEEAPKLCLSEGYKRQQIEAFKSVMTKNRELHAKLIRECMSLGAGGEAKPLRISPDLRVEPTPTCYLRTAQAYDFVWKQLRNTLGAKAGGHIIVEQQPMDRAVAKIIELLTGMYLFSCEDIGMLPMGGAGFVDRFGAQQPRELAARFLTDAGTNECYSVDTRYVIPIMQEGLGKKARHWMTCGVKLVKIKSEYLRPPKVAVVNTRTGQSGAFEADAGGASVGEIFVPVEFVPAEFYMPVDAFAEADSSKTPLAREEFRRLCDGCRTVDDVKRAMEARLNKLSSRPARMVIVLIAIILAVVIGGILIARRKLLRVDRHTMLHLLLLVVVSAGVWYAILRRERRQALLEAVTAQDAATVRSLLDKGVEPDVRGDYHATLLTIAAGYGNPEIVRLLLEHGADPDAVSDWDRTAIYDAAACGHLEAFEVLLDHGATLPVTGPAARDLMTGAAIGGATGVVQILFDRGIPINPKEADYTAPLPTAARAGNLEMVMYLLGRGADINGGQDDGLCTPLAQALGSGHTNVAEMLIQRGAKILPRHLEAAAQADDVGMLGRILERGPSPDVPEDNWIKGPPGTRAVELACSYGHVNAIRLLMEHGAKPRDAFKKRINDLLAGKGDASDGQLVPAHAYAKPVTVTNRGIRIGLGIAALVWLVLFAAARPVDIAPAE